MRFAWQAQGFRVLRCRCLKPQTLNPWKRCKFHVTEGYFAGIISREVTGVRTPRLNFFVAGAVLLKHPFENR